jgi:hypothetical protein
MTVMADRGSAIILSTALLGPLVVPGSSGQGASRAAIYATRARGDGTCSDAQ